MLTADRVSAGLESSLPVTCGGGEGSPGVWRVCERALIDGCRMAGRMWEFSVLTSDLCYFASVQKCSLSSSSPRSLASARSEALFLSPAVADASECRRGSPQTRPLGAVGLAADDKHWGVLYSATALGDPRISAGLEDLAQDLE